MRFSDDESMSGNEEWREDEGQSHPGRLNQDIRPQYGRPAAPSPPPREPEPPPVNEEDQYLDEVDAKFAEAEYYRSFLRLGAIFPDAPEPQIADKVETALKRFARQQIARLIGRASPDDASLSAQEIAGLRRFLAFTDIEVEGLRRLAIRSTSVAAAVPVATPARTAAPVARPSRGAAIQPQAASRPAARPAPPAAPEQKPPAPKKNVRQKSRIPFPSNSAFHAITAGKAQERVAAGNGGDPAAAAASEIAQTLQQMTGQG